MSLLPFGKSETRPRSPTRDSVGLSDATRKAAGPISGFAPRGGRKTYVATDTNAFQDCKDLAVVASTPGFFEKNALFLDCVPLATLSTLIALLALFFRRSKVVPSEFLASLDHPYAAQVFGIITGYLLIMRLNVAINRWDNGMSCAQQMNQKFHDAYSQIMCFISTAKEGTSDDDEHSLLEKLEGDFVHLFSLLHALCCAHLCFAEHQAYGVANAAGAQAFEYFDYTSMDHGCDAFAFFAFKQHEQTIESRPADANRKYWPFGLTVHGKLKDWEKASLRLCKNHQAHLIMHWIVRLCSVATAQGLVTIPPPIFSRVYQELSNGLLGYTQAYKLAVLPFPPPLTRIAYILLIAIVLFIPVIMERFTQALVFTPLLTFCSVFGFLVMHVVTMHLEMPFGDDYIDLPLRELHEAFNASLLLHFVAPGDELVRKYVKEPPSARRSLEPAPPAALPTQPPRPVRDFDEAEAPRRGAAHFDEAEIPGTPIRPQSPGYSPSAARTNGGTRRSPSRERPQQGRVNGRSKDRTTQKKADLEYF